VAGLERTYMLVTDIRHP